MLMSITLEIGQRIRFYRKKKGLSQEKLAELCDFHPTYIGQLERGEKNASIESIYRLTKGLEISITQLLEDIDTMECSNTNTSLEIYRLCQQLPERKQKAIKQILEELLEIME